MSDDPRAEGFRNVYANIFNVTFTAHEVGVVFGIQTQPGTDGTAMEAQAGVYMTHSGAKLFATLLGLLLDDFEDAAGRKIETDLGKLDAVREQIAAVKAARDAAKKG